MASSANDVYVQMQKIASDTQVKLQQMTDASTAKSFDYNAREAKASRDWQTQMSNTSHQREVADLKKAGLNPVLSANQGANAYTTSSASAQADNAANAVASITSSRLSGMAGIESSNIGARATKAAAATNAAAMKAASAQSAAAAKYAADAQFRAAQLNYAAKVYSVDKSLEGIKYQIDNKLPSNKYEFASSWLRHTGIENDARNFISDLWKNPGETTEKAIKDTISRMKEFGMKHPNSAIYAFNKITTNMTNRSLTRLGIQKTAENRVLFFKAYVMHDKLSQSILNGIIKFKSKYASNRVSLSSPQIMKW